MCFRREIRPKFRGDIMAGSVSKLPKAIHHYLVDSTHLKNISQNGNLPNRGEHEKCHFPYTRSC